MLKIIYLPQCLFFLIINEGCGSDSNDQLRTADSTVVYQAGYRVVSFLSYFEKNTVSANPYGATDNIPSREEDCHTWATEKISTFYNEVARLTFDRLASVFLMKSKCFPDPRTPIKFYIQTGNESPNGDPKWASKVTMRIGVVTKEAYDYAKKAIH